MEDNKKNQDDLKAQDDVKVEESNESKKTDTKTSVVIWAILAVVMVLCASSGFFLGRLFASLNKTQTQPSKTDKIIPLKNPEMENSLKNPQKGWYYDLEPVVANLDEPSVTRYVRATITLEVSSALAREKGEKLLEEKKPVLTNWLTIYLASLTLEDTRGNRNLKRIQCQILDAFNERLFPDAKPQIKHILFKEFAIQ